MQHYTKGNYARYAIQSLFGSCCCTKKKPKKKLKTQDNQKSKTPSTTTKPVIDNLYPTYNLKIKTITPTLKTIKEISEEKGVNQNSVSQINPGA